MRNRLTGSVAVAASETPSSPGLATAMEEHERLIGRCNAKLKTIESALEKLGEEEQVILKQTEAVGKMVVVRNLNDAEVDKLVTPMRTRLRDIRVEMKQLQGEQVGLNSKKRMAENLMQTARGAKDDRDLHKSMALIVKATTEFVGATPDEVADEVREVEEGYEALREMRESYLPIGSDTGAVEDSEADSDLMAALRLGQDRVVDAAAVGVAPLTPAEITASLAIDKDKLAMIRAELNGTSGATTTGGVTLGGGGAGGSSGGGGAGFPPFPVAPSHLPVLVSSGPGSAPNRWPLYASSALSTTHEEDAKAEEDDGDFGFLSSIGH